MVGFLEPLAELMNGDIQQILSDILNDDLETKLRKHFLKYMFLNINFICKTPISFQKFAAQTVVDMYLRPGLNMHEHISLDWIIKYQTICSILETNDESKELATGQISAFRTSGTASMDEDLSKGRDYNVPQSYNYIFGKRL